MFLRLFTELREARVPVSLREYLTLMEAMDKQVIGLSTDDFYYLSRAALVKDERNLDKFDRVFGHVFKGFEKVDESLTAEIPAEWLKKLTEKFLTEEEKAATSGLGPAGPAPSAPMATTLRACGSDRTKAVMGAR